MLPGRLDGALAAFLVVGDALLRALTGAPISPGMPVTLARKIVSTVGLAEVVPVRRTADGVEPLASGHWPMQALPAPMAGCWCRRERRLSGRRQPRDAGVPMNDRTRPEIALLDAVRAAARQEQFLEVVSAEDAKARFEKHLDLAPLSAEAVSLDDALGRVLGADIAAPIDVPPFDRSNVDGFAVRAADTTGATDATPRRLCSMRSARLRSPAQACRHAGHCDRHRDR